MMHYVRAFYGIVWRELLRFLQQRERFFAALVRPLIWLIIFAAGFRAALGISIIPPYQTYITYDVYITPGLLAMIQLFQGMQSSLSMVYDREMGSMRVLLTTPLPRWFLLVARLFGGVIVSLFQVYTFALIAYFCGVELPLWGYLTALPALILTGLMFGALGMLLSSTIKQLENFAGIMNFVIFPMFFASSALYPLWKMREGSLWLYYICLYNPFTWAVELIRFAFYLEVNWQALGIVGGCTLLFLALSVWAYDPSFGIQQRKVGTSRGGRLGSVAGEIAGEAPQQIGVDRLDRVMVALSLRHVDGLDREHARRPRREQDELVGQHDRLAGVVGDQDCRGRARLPHFEQELAQSIGGPLVERDERLIEQKQVWLGGEGAGERHAARQPERQLLRVARQHVGDAEGLSQPFEIGL